MTPEIAARLDAAGIAIAAQARDYCMFVRGPCVALVRAAEGRFTSIGSSGLMTEKGLAYLVWREGEALLAAHGSQSPADAEQVDTIRHFSRDLKSILELPGEV